MNRPYLVRTSGRWWLIDGETVHRVIRMPDDGRDLYLLAEATEGEAALLHDLLVLGSHVSSTGSIYCPSSFTLPVDPELIAYAEEAHP